MQNILKTNSLSKSYRGYLAVNSVNMTINKGDIYGFVGQNGSGKTTIIRMITGLTYPSEGDFSLFNTMSNSPDILESRKKIGAIVENPAIYQSLGAYDNLKIQFNLYGRTDFEEINSILETVKLNPNTIINKKVKDFSLGMRQRLAIGMCLASNPEFLVLDEPTNGLDPEGVVEVRELLLELNKNKGITILISSHILSELSKIATKYGIIHNGRLIKEVSAQEVFDSLDKQSIIKLNDTKDVLEVLEKLEIKKYEIKENKLIINGEWDTSKLIVALSEKGIIVNGIEVINPNIEDYYLKVVGGYKNA